MRPSGSLQIIVGYVKVIFIMRVNRKELAHIVNNLQISLFQSSYENETVEISEDLLWGLQDVSEQTGHQHLQINEVLYTYRTRSSNSPFENLKIRLSGATSLLICDPYFFTADTNVDHLIDLLPKSLSRIQVIHSGSANCYWQDTADEIQEKLPGKISMSRLVNEDIHDRVWIKDRCSGFVVGTSLNGIGKKIAFLLDIPPEDLDKFISILDPITKSGWIKM